MTESKNKMLAQRIFFKKIVKASGIFVVFLLLGGLNNIAINAIMPVDSLIHDLMPLGFLLALFEMILVVEFFVWWHICKQEALLICEQEELEIEKRRNRND